LRTWGYFTFRQAKKQGGKDGSGGLVVGDWGKLQIGIQLVAKMSK
jgi:hypothetical protein